MRNRLLLVTTLALLASAMLVWIHGCGSPAKVASSNSASPPGASAGQLNYRYLIEGAKGEEATPAFRRRGGGRPDSGIVNFPPDGSGLATPPDLGPEHAAASNFSTAINPSEELWIISKLGPAPTPAQPSPDDIPGSGALVVRQQPEDPAATETPAEPTDIPIPLEHTDVEARIDAYIAGVRVTQRFVNPFDEKIEAVYVFPLPQDAAVDGFVMTVGERKIRGIIREREEAERIYADAKRQGHRAALMTQERPNIFTQSVANIEPGKSIDVDITYFHTLPFRDGWFEYVFPMVVGPRFNPPCSTDGVGAVARGNPGASGQDTELQYLRPGERSGHDISLSVNLDAGVTIEAIDCPTHDVAVTRDQDLRLASVTLSESDSIPNRDFVLRYRVSGSDVKSAILTHADPRHVEDGGFFSMLLVPPDDLSRLARQPVEMVFVLDCSGSMSGKPIEQARQAASHALSLLGPDDTFRVIRFSNDSDSMGEAIPATRANVRRGLHYIESLRANGGTMMIRGIQAALSPRADRDRRRLVVFMTDGYIGNETDILAAIEKHVGEGAHSARIFSFGVGSSVNRYLMERMAKLGNGAVAYIGLNDDPRGAMDLFLERTSHPALENVKIDFGGMKADGVYPSSLPDLFVGRPVVITGRYKGDAQSVTLRGRAGSSGSSDLSFEVPVFHGKPRPALAAVWARKRIEDLADRSHGAGDAKRERLAGEIKMTALEFGLMSAFTSFIAVDGLEKTDGMFGGTVDVPVEVPEGVQYSKTVGR
jgi:Ca-activated chloride channel family protein